MSVTFATKKPSLKVENLSIRCQWMMRSQRIERLPGRHLYFLDDHLFGDPRFASALFDGMKGMKRLWQAAATVNSVLAPRLVEKAADSGLRSLFVGFETLNRKNLLEQNKYQNLDRDY